jgi:hypothetical protein
MSCSPKPCFVAPIVSGAFFKPRRFPWPSLPALTKLDMIELVIGGMMAIRRRRKKILRKIPQGKNVVSEKPAYSDSHEKSDKNIGEER